MYSAGLSRLLFVPIWKEPLRISFLRPPSGFALALVSPCLFIHQDKAACSPEDLRCFPSPATTWIADCPLISILRPHETGRWGINFLTQRRDQAACIRAE